MGNPLCPGLSPEDMVQVWRTLIEFDLTETMSSERNSDFCPEFLPNNPVHDYLDQSDRTFEPRTGPNFSTNKIVTSNKEFLEDGPLGGAHPAMRPRKNDQKKEKRLSYAEAHKEEFERPKSQIRKVSRVYMTSRARGRISPCPRISVTTIETRKVNLWQIFLTKRNKSVQ